MFKTFLFFKTLNEPLNFHIENRFNFGALNPLIKGLFQISRFPSFILLALKIQVKIS